MHKKMTNNKAAGPSRVDADMLKVAQDARSEWLKDVCNAVVKEGRLPEDCNRSWTINVYKEQWDDFEYSSYRGIYC